MKYFWLLLVLKVTVVSCEKIFIYIRGPERDLNILDTEINNEDLENKFSSQELVLLRFVSDFAIMSQWESIVIFVSNSSDYSKILPSLNDRFSGEGKFVSIYFTSKPFLPDSITHNRHILGIVYICDVLDEDFFRKVSDLNLFDFYRSWLIIQPQNNKNSKLEELIKGLNIGLGSNVVVATVNKRTLLTTTTSFTPTTTTSRGEYLVRYRKRLIEDEIFTERLKRSTIDPFLIIRLVQIYKANKLENETLKIDLGVWDVPNGLLKTHRPISIEHRWDLGGSKIFVGVKNSSQEKTSGNVIPDRFSLESEIDEESYFLELFDCLMYGVNASFELNQFQKLGYRNEEGGWTNLLGAVVDGSVDFALETMNVNADKTQDMSFTYAIIRTMTNIYFRKPKSSGLRDIFLAPFSPRLLFCVITTSFLLAVAMISITIVNYHMVESKKSKTRLKIFTKKKTERSVVMITKEERKWEISEAVLWSVSVLCMQGSQWSPNSISGSLLLINGLLFALIIYNSFAAFITSVLSVKDVKIKNLKDLAESDFAFGYTLGNADELFLRTVNNTLLRELYFKGLRENDGVSDPVVGMHRTSKGKYAFFVGARKARRALRTVVAHNTRCEFHELSLPVTKSYASIPVTKNSPLRKILNYKIIRLIETGILHRFQRLILPSMPRCVEKTTFNSARLTDVYSAFFVLAVGWVASLIILAGELIWHRRKKLQNKNKTSDFMYGGFKSEYGMFWLK